MHKIRAIYDDLKQNEIDYQGKKLFAKILNFFTVVATVGGILVGIVYREFYAMIYFNTVVFLIATVFLVPSWPFYRRHLIVPAIRLE